MRPQFRDGTFGDGTRALSGHPDGRARRKAPIVFENASAIAFVPYFARYAYECFVAPKTTHPGLSSMSPEELRDFAEALKVLTVRYDNLWQMSFPYVMTLHHAPSMVADHAAFISMSSFILRCASPAC